MSINPKAPIRRFDIFAEYTRQKAIEDGMPEDEAAGYGLWVAKVVATRKWGGGPSKPHHKPGSGSGAGGDKKEEEAEETHPKEKWHDLDGQPQTDELFEQQIVGRMGLQFYNTVFAPAIEDALKEGKRYESIRDTLRKDWRPGGIGTAGSAGEKTSE